MIRCSKILLGLLLACAAPAAHAASLRMSPIGLDLTAPEKAGAISLTNTGTDPTDLQVRIFKWSQADGKDVLSETRDVLVSPPIVTIKGGDTYKLRVVRVAVTPVSGEEDYRLVIDELPKPIDPRATGQGVRMVLRTSMPVFFAEKGIIPDMKFDAWLAGGKGYVEATNRGKRHIKLAGLSLSEGADRLSFGSGLNGYILPGQTMRFDAPLNKVKLAPGPANLLGGVGSSIPISQPVTLGVR